MRTRAILTTALLTSAVIAGIVTYIAAQHNPQGEFDGPAGRLSAMLLIRNVFAVWFFVIAGTILVGALGIRWLNQRQ